MKKLTKLLFWISISLLWNGCGDHQPTTQASFYHWKTVYRPTEFEQTYLDQLKIEKLYVKYFDVVWDANEQRVKPTAKVSFQRIPSQAVIPTIYITNLAIAKLGQAQSKSLADKILKLIFELHPEEISRPEEIQIDCDWTAGTREAYFDVLRHLNQDLDSLDIKLSATIRLHQLKYPKQTGVPPVDRGMLMFYNMGDLDNPDEDNSILDIAVGKRYLSNASSYPIQLDVALPVFGWGVLIRQGKPIRLLNNLYAHSVAGVPWMTKLGNDLMRVDTSHYFWGHYLYAGDILRMESASSAQVLEAASLLHNQLDSYPRNVAIYHLDSATLANHRLTLLDSVFGEFEN